MNRDPLQGTGRTTRMIQAAFRKAQEGHIVFVVAASQQHARTLFDMAANKLRPVGFDSVRPARLSIGRNGIRYPFGHIHVIHPGNIESTRGYSSALVFWDHFTRESVLCR